ncbi:MAG: hypothetical protein IJL17_02185 [Kiritimatiellae bacterium]|nr:hypothetical protein [Kiritimatiellia bacterium]
MNYVLGEQAAAWLRRAMGAGYRGTAYPARPRGRDESQPLPPPFHFELERTVEEGQPVWTVGEGAVQDGKTTVWFEGGEVDLEGGGEEIVYASLGDATGEGATGKEVTVGVVADADELEALQQDTSATFWPLYYLVDGVITVDYRPLLGIGAGADPDEISIDAGGTAESEDPEADPVGGLLQIKDWNSSASDESDKLAEMIGPGPDEEEEPFEVLARQGGAGGALKYVAFGRIVSRFHFKLTRTVEEAEGESESVTWRVGAGGVQKGKTTIWFDGDDVDVTDTGTYIVYAEIGTQDDVVAVGTVASVAALAQKQESPNSTTWPLYKVVNGEVVADYRPLFNVGDKEKLDEVSIDREGEKASPDPGGDPETGLVEIKGWSSSDAIEASTLSQMISPSSGGGSAPAEPFEVLARKNGSGGPLRYISLGRLPAGSSMPNVDVITDVSFAFSEAGRLQATLSKVNLSTGATSTVVRDIDLWKQNVDADGAYSDSTHAFTKKTIPGVRTEATAPSSPETVFTATPHSAE